MSKKIIDILAPCEEFLPNNLLIFGRVECYDFREKSNNTKTYGYYTTIVQYGEEKRIKFRYLGENIENINIGKDYTILNPDENNFIKTNSRTRALDILVYQYIENQKEDLLALEFKNIKKWAVLLRQDEEPTLDCINSDDFFDFLHTYGRMIKSKEDSIREFRLQYFVSKIEKEANLSRDFSRKIELFQRQEEVFKNRYQKLIKKFKEKDLESVAKK